MHLLEIMSFCHTNEGRLRGILCKVKDGTVLGIFVVRGFIRELNRIYLKKRKTHMSRSTITSLAFLANSQPVSVAQRVCHASTL